MTFITKKTPCLKPRTATINLFLMLVLTIFMLNFSSAWTDSKFELDDSKIIEKNTSTNFGVYTITKHAWYDVLKIWKSETIKKVSLLENTETCSNCYAIKEIDNFEKGKLIEDVKFDKEVNGKWIEWNNFINWKIEIEEEFDLFKEDCISGEQIYDETNGTYYNEQICRKIKIGTEKRWVAYDFDKEYEIGNYTIKLSGGKKPSVKYDWKVKIDGIWTEAWAVWGNISEGDEAEVNLNAPNDESIQYSNPVTLNASGNVTGGAYLTNATLYTNETGSWEGRNTTNAILSVEEYDYFSDEIINSTLWTNTSSYASTTEAEGYLKLRTTGDYTSGTANVLSKILDLQNNSISEFKIQYWYVKAEGTKTSNVNVKFGDYTLFTKTNVGESEITGGGEIFQLKYINSTYTSIRNKTGTGNWTDWINITQTGNQLSFTTTTTGSNGTDVRRAYLHIDYVIYNKTELLTNLFSFTNTYSSGDSILWNMQFCDSDGDCGFSPANRTFSMDKTPPTILVTSGNGTQNYGNISTNHTINITFTDTNLDDCWINYNGTNQTFDCTSGIDSPVNFTLQYNLYNATIWANDTLGNENSSFVSWDYRVFETNRTFSNETLSGSIEDFSINVTLGNETEIVSAIFVYNGTNISSVITSIGNFRLITIDDFEIPIFSSAENISFYWEILLSDGTNFSTYTSTHLVSVLNLDNCSTYTFQLANISLFDEETLQLIIGDIEVYYSILNKPNYNSIKNLSGIFENISNTLICSDLNLSNQNLAYSTEIRYSSEKGLFDDVGYAKEFYHIQKADIGELITISLYDLHLNETTEFEIEYQNEDLVRVANAVVQLQRKYIAEDIYRVVEAPITSNEGTAILHIDLNTNKYKITIIKDGVVLDIFDNIVFVCDNVLSGQCEQKLYGSIDPTNDIPLETIQDFSYTLSEVNNTITIDFSIPSGVPSNINFLMYQSDQFGTTTLCNRTIISSAGSTSCIYNNTITDSYLDLILTRDGNVISSRTYIVQEADGVDFLDNNFFIVFIFLISIVGMAFTSPEWIIMNSVIVFVISGALWLLNGMNFVMGLGGLAWLILGAGILIFKLTKQEDR